MPENAHELTLGIVRAFAAAPDLEQACDGVLDLLTRELEFRRVLIALRHGDRTEAWGRGFSASLCATVKREISDGSEPTPGPGDLTETTHPGLSLASLASREALEVLPFQADGAQLVGVLVIDAAPAAKHRERLAWAIQAAAPSLKRVSEVEGLHKELERSRSDVSHLQIVFDSLPDPVLVLDAEDQLVLCNSRGAELLLAGPDDSAGRKRAVESNNLFFSASRARAVLPDARDARELLLVDPVDGSDLLFEIWPAELQAVPGPVEEQIFILRDITDLKRATSELQEQYKRSISAQHQANRESERLNVILANIGKPILVTDGWSDIVLMNHAAAGLFEDADGDASDSSRLRRTRANGARITGLISDFLLQSRRQRHQELELGHPHEDRGFPARAVLTKIISEHGEPVAVVCVIEDLTEEREVQRLAEELTQLNRDLERRVEKATSELSRRNVELEGQREELARASRLKTEFLAMMSHELRTPLNAILGYNSLLKDGILGTIEERQEQALLRVEASSEHLLMLINDLLDLSKVEAGMIALQPVAVDVGSVLENISQAMRPQAEQKGLAFHLEVAPGTPPVRADVTRLRQVIINLTANAIKFTSEGHVRVRAFVREGTDRVRFEVEDTGRGILPEHQEAIFEGFYQVDPFESRGQGGTGLGLSISRRLLSLMDGTLSLQSEFGVGSVFFAELPLADGTESRTGEADAPDEDAGNPVPFPLPAPRRTLPPHPLRSPEGA